MFKPHQISEKPVTFENQIASCEVSGIGKKSLTFLSCPRTLKCWFVLKLETPGFFQMKRIETLKEAIELYNSIPI